MQPASVSTTITSASMGDTTSAPTGQHMLPIGAPPPYSDSKAATTTQEGCSPCNACVLCCSPCRYCCSGCDAGKEAQFKCLQAVLCRFECGCKGCCECSKAEEVVASSIQAGRTGAAFRALTSCSPGCADCLKGCDVKCAKCGICCGSTTALTMVPGMAACGVICGLLCILCAQEGNVGGMQAANEMVNAEKNLTSKSQRG